MIVELSEKGIKYWASIFIFDAPYKKGCNYGRKYNKKNSK